MDEFPTRFNCLLMSLCFHDLNAEYNYLHINDYISTVLDSILHYPNCELLCRKMNEYFIFRIITMTIHFNNNRYKSNRIQKKLFYIIFYYIQDRTNIHIISKTKYSINGIQELKNIRDNFESVDPYVINMLDMVLIDIDLYFRYCKLYCKNILNYEFKKIPTDIISLIIEFMPQQNIFNIAELF